MLAQKFLNAGADIDAGVGIPDHRVAAVHSSRIGLPHPLHGVQDGGTDCRVAHVPRQHCVAMLQHVSRRDAIDQLAPIAARVGPTPAEIAVPLDEIPADSVSPAFTR